MNNKKYNSIVKIFKDFFEEIKDDGNGFFASFESSEVSTKRHIEGKDITINIINNGLDFEIVGEDDDKIKIESKYFKNIIVENGCIIINFDYGVVVFERF